jgi:chemotaxis protein MotB
MRKKEEEPEKENSERWLLTYSDMITLLLALFIMMYTMSTIDTGKFKAISQQLSVMLGQGNSVVQVDSGGANEELLNNIDMSISTPSPEYRG